MAYRPPNRPNDRSRRPIAASRLWLLITIVVGVVVLFFIRHLHDEADAPKTTSNRPLLLQQAQAHLRADPNIADLVYVPARDQWEVTPAMPDADPTAFGRYLCFTLAQAGVTQPHTTVRVIDGAKLEASGFDYAAASRGTIACKEGTS